MKRECGGCTLCCKLMPVQELNKLAGQRCQHQRHGKGCAVHHQPRRGFPHACGLWHCRWLVNDDAADLRRPDRAHYVIDMMPDFITAVPPGGGDPIEVLAVQVWCDPDFRTAHRDPALRAWLERKGEKVPLVAIVRFNSQDAVILIPPGLSTTGWHEIVSAVKTGTHGFDEVAAVWEAAGAAGHAEGSDEGTGSADKAGDTDRAADAPAAGGVSS